MPKVIGRIAFLVFIWFFALRYYVECIGLPKFSEKITITITFWTFTLLLSCKLFGIVRNMMKDEKLGGWFDLSVAKRVLRDRKVHLLLAIIGYIILIPVIGFFTSSFLSFCLFCFLLGSRSLFKIAAQGLIITIITFAIFVMLLQLSLPKGFVY
jgi:hypothetical protein